MGRPHDVQHACICADGQVQIVILVWCVAAVSLYHMSGHMPGWHVHAWAPSPLYQQLQHRREVVS